MADGGYNRKEFQGGWDSGNSRPYLGVWIFAYTAGTGFTSHAVNGKNFFDGEDPATSNSQTKAQGNVAKDWVGGYFNGDLYDIEIRASDAIEILKQISAARGIGDTHITDNDTSDLAVSTDSRWHLHIKRTAGNLFNELQTQDGSSVISLIKKTSDDTADIFDDIITKGPWADLRAYLPAGFVTDGSVDYTTEITAWMNDLGSGFWESSISGVRQGFLPPGKWKYTSNLPAIPNHTTIFGVPFNSILVPNTGVTKGLIQGAGATINGIAIDGINSDAGCVGFSVGESGLTNEYFCHQLYVVRFDAADQLGALIDQSVNGHFTECSFDDNHHGLKTLDSGTGNPSMLIFNDCKFNSNNSRGAWLSSGTGIVFKHCNFEVNGDEGLYAVEGGTENLQDIVLDEHCWFEGNHQNETSGVNRNAKYHANMQCTRPKFISTFFSNDTNGAKAIVFDASVDFLVDNCSLPEQDATVSVITSGGGTIVNWPWAIGEPIDRISDAVGEVKFNVTDQGEFTPSLTFATPGDLNVVLSTQNGRWTRNGRIYEYVIDLVTSTFTHTTASGLLRVITLPAASRATISSYHGVGSWQGITKASYTQVVSKIPANVNRIEFEASGSGQSVASVTAADVPTGGTVKLQFTGSYEI